MEKQIKITGDNIQISDGYHTFDELYEHRIQLYLALCRSRGLANHSNDLDIWASKLHSDGTSFDDWFILGINKEKGEQISYHLPLKFWEEVLPFAKILDKAPEFDGHTSADVLERLKNL